MSWTCVENFSICLDVSGVLEILEIQQRFSSLPNVVTTVLGLQDRLHLSIITAEIENVLVLINKD